LCIILDLVETSQLEMLRSPIHDLENSRNSLKARRLRVKQCLKHASRKGELSIWQIGKGDYVKDRDALFTNETVDSLFQQAVSQQSK
jgi:hypothetical protein